MLPKYTNLVKLELDFDQNFIKKEIFKGAFTCTKENLVRTRPKGGTARILRLKKKLEFFKGLIGAYGPAKTPVFLYKTYRSVPLFLAGPNKFFI